MTPVFEAAMFDFGSDIVPDHIDEDTEWFDPADGEYRLIAGKDTLMGTELACWLPDLTVAETLARAYLRKCEARAWPYESVWIAYPDGSYRRFLSDGAIFDAVGSEVEHKMRDDYLRSI
jgi:hypothetical protein